MNQDQLTEARRRAIHALCVAQAKELVSVEVFELRHALVHEAPSAAAVEAIVADLEVTGEADAAFLPAPGTGAVLPDFPPVPGELPLSALFSTFKREGIWVVPPVLRLKAFCGEVKLDLRDALFTSDVVDVTVDATMGSIELTVPAGTQVENECTAVFGDIEHKRHDALDVPPNGLLVRINGRALFGGVKIRERLPTDLLPPERRGVKGWLAKVADSVD